MSLPSRLRRHLSFANLVACLALFVALGGSAYAASQINGNKIVKQSIGGGKLKNETITNRQIKKNSLNSSVIDLSTLATVPSAQSAVTANSATTANSASTATTATSAKSAESATTASRATTAETATSATSAGHATSADTAGHADSAGEAASLEGKTASELTDSCLTGTEPFGGMCWDEDEQLARTWFAAIEDCSTRDGHLPGISELIAYVLRPGPQVSGENWSGEVSEIEPGNKEIVVGSTENARFRVDASGGATRAYRCVFPSTNAH